MPKTSTLMRRKRSRFHQRLSNSTSAIEKVSLLTQTIKTDADDSSFSTTWMSRRATETRKLTKLWRRETVYSTLSSWSSASSWSSPSRASRMDWVSCNGTLHWTILSTRAQWMATWLARRSQQAQCWQPCKSKRSTVSQGYLGSLSVFSRRTHWTLESVGPGTRTLVAKWPADRLKTDTTRCTDTVWDRIWRRRTLDMRETTTIQRRTLRTCTRLRSTQTKSETVFTSLVRPREK